MLSLDSPRWSELIHAYGSAADIPSLLQQLQSLPSSENDREPWFSIWSALAHQGDVYPASFAAVPHVVSCLAQAPTKADFSFFQFPAWVEICRQKRKVAVPDDLVLPYRQALAKLPELVAAAASRKWDETLLSCALAAIAASQGFAYVAEAALELNTEVAEDFLKWHLHL
jgi:hypothetical protein